MWPISNYESDAPWQVVYTWSRHEKNVAQHLSGSGIEHFLPIYRATRNWNGRRARVNLPLFPSYIFVRIARRDRVRVLQVPGVVHLVTFNGSPAEVPNGEIQGMRAALELRASEPHPYLATGTRVRIGTGPLSGLTGFITRHKGGARVVISVDSIHRSVAVELESNDLECCDYPLQTAAMASLHAA